MTKQILPIFSYIFISSSLLIFPLLFPLLPLPHLLLPLPLLLIPLRLLLVLHLHLLLPRPLQLIFLLLLLINEHFLQRSPSPEHFYETKGQIERKIIIILTFFYFLRYLAKVFSLETTLKYLTNSLLGSFELLLGGLRTALASKTLDQTNASYRQLSSHLG